MTGEALTETDDGVDVDDAGTVGEPFVMVMAGLMDLEESLEAAAAASWLLIDCMMLSAACPLAAMSLDRDAEAESVSDMNGYLTFFDS